MGADRRVHRVDRAAAGVARRAGRPGRGHGADAPEVAARAFEAFFTTKGAGEGAGLGLDVAWRIVVERHGGEITIDSPPGETILRARLPERPPR